jgi:hypothetical protein
MMICQTCGIEAPTKYVAFYQNIGALVMRFSRSINGNLCKSCVHKYFWQYTLMTPFILLNNIFRYIFCLGMEGVPFGAQPPSLTEDVVQRLEPHIEQLIDRIKNGDKFDRVANDIAMRAGVSPGQVALYLHALVAAAEREQH